MKYADPPTVDFRYYHGPVLVRLTIGTAIDVAQRFNRVFVKRLGELYLSNLMSGGGTPLSSLAERVARALHWYSQAEAQLDETIAFVCYWIGLEALVLKSSNVGQKRQGMQGRLSRLVAYHNPGVDWAEAIGDL